MIFNFDGSFYSFLIERAFMVGCSASGVQSDDLVTRLQRNLQSKCVTKGAEIAAERSIEISEPRRFGEFLFGTGTPRGVFVAKKF